MIGLYEYNTFPDDVKANMVWDKGTYLTMRTEGIYKINLHSLSNFFVEVWYEPTENKISQFRTFKSKNALEPYYNYIDLNQLLN